jgi:hypothetical protein
VRRAAAPVRWDVACGAAVLLAVTVSFMLAGAAVLYPRRVAGEQLGSFEGWHLLTDQASIWQAIHPSLIWVYYVCVVAALWGTLQAYPDIYARGITAYCRAMWPNRSFEQSRLQRWICLYVFVTATSLVWSEVNFNAMTLVVTFLATSLGVAMAMTAGLYLNSQLPPAYRTRWWMLVGGLCSALALLAVSGVAAWGLWREFVGAAAG